VATAAGDSEGDARLRKVVSRWESSLKRESAVTAKDPFDVPPTSGIHFPVASDGQAELEQPFQADARRSFRQA
jgi:hypothetical protein